MVLFAARTRWKLVAPIREERAAVRAHGLPFRIGLRVDGDAVVAPFYERFLAGSYRNAGELHRDAIGIRKATVSPQCLEPAVEPRLHRWGNLVSNLCGQRPAGAPAKAEIDDSFPFYRTVE